MDFKKDTKKHASTIIAIAAGLIIGLALALPPTTSNTKKKLQGTVTVDLGQKRVAFGSSSQASELLTLISDTPGQGKYTITFTDDNGRTEISCDFNTGKLVRTKNYSSGKNTIEGWSGDILYRIKSAAENGSFNDTSSGKQYGTMRSY